jgi:hypothetical protein
MVKLRKELPKAGISTAQHLVSEHILTPLTRAEKDPKQIPKALFLSAVYEAITTPVFLGSQVKLLGSQIKEKLLPLQPASENQQHIAAKKASKLAMKITADAEFNLGLDDFKQAHGPLTPNETMYLNAHRDRRDELTRLPLLAKVLQALSGAK